MYTLYTSSKQLIIEPPLQSGSTMCLVLSCEEEDTKSVKLGLQSKSELAMTPLTRPIKVDAILGIVRLIRGCYLGVVTNSVSVCKIGLDRAEFRNVRGAQFIPIPRSADLKKHHKSLTTEQYETEAAYLDMLHSIVNSNSLYFSHQYDITQTSQRISQLNSKTYQNIKWPGKSMALENFENSSQHQRADRRFYWNLHLVQDFAQAGFEDWIHPMLCGLICVNYNMRFDESEAYFTYVFISRKSRNRPGTRFNVRGVDENGHAANFVETEQIFIPHSHSEFPFENENVGLCSYVLTRGSIPIAWTQPATCIYTPKVHTEKSFADSYARFHKHFHGSDAEHGFDIYGKVLGVNLVDRTGGSRIAKEQRHLGEMYENFVNKYNSSDLDYFWFDFHHECRKMQFGNMSKLIRNISDSIRDFGFFVLTGDGKVKQWQSGVIRVNCMDNLDRTNAVQTVIARFNFVEVMLFLKNIDPSEARRAVLHQDVLNSGCTAFEESFGRIWRSNADTLSVLYAGTPALKTRLGTLGKLQDGFNSVSRYFINNFLDASKQDALDLFLGVLDPHKVTYDVSRAKKGFKMLQMALLCVAILILCVLLALFSSSRWIVMLSSTSAVGLLIVIQQVVTNGLPAEKLVKPLLTH